MLRDRIFFIVLLLIVLIAGSLLFFQKQEWSIVLLGLTSLAAIIFVYSVHSQVKIFSKHHISTTTGSLNSLLKLVEGHFSQQREEIKQIVVAIEHVGTAETLNTSMLNKAVGQAIVNLQNKLIELKEVEEQRVWAAQGIASISELRKDNGELTDYSFQIISLLVKFLKANQGAFYVQSNELPDTLELLSTYAYGRRKYSYEKVVLELGTGLVGQCALSKEMILMTDVPKDYIKITSGLGEALPRCIVIVPVLFRDQIFGVLEIASFQKFADYQLEFLSKACETIGLELSGIKAQEQTRKLLEESREEELRQNLEEMKRTQEQMLMKEEELSRQLITTQRAMAMAEAEQKKNEAILEGCMDAVVSFNENGIVEYFNQAAEEIFGYSRDEIVGNAVENILNIHIVESPNGSMIIRNAQGNEVNVRTEINTNDKTGEEISLLLTATKVKIDKDYLFTLFAQKVSVELF